MHYNAEVCLLDCVLVDGYCTDGTGVTPTSKP